MLRTKNRGMIWMLLPGVVITLVFCYIPMGGIVIAFQDYSIFRGIAGSRWVGLKHFIRFFSQPNVFRTLENTVAISCLNILIGFPAPLIIALLLNEIRGQWTKRSIQTVIYLPHFLSWIIVYGIVVTLFSTSGAVMRLLCGPNPPVLLTNVNAIRWVLAGTAVWKEAGWGTVVYMAAITSVDPQLYESAYMDGAGRFRRLWHITLPSILPTIVMLLILRIGNLMASSTEQVLLFLNPLVMEKGDVIGTYVYRMGLGQMEYSFSTAIGLFNSAVNFILVLSTNSLSRRLVGRSIW